MAVWLVRAGAHGEYEQKFLREGRVYVTREELDVDVPQIPDRKQLLDEMAKRYPDAKPRGIMNYASQVLPFAKEMKPGDPIILPIKSQRTIAVAEITGDYHFESKGPEKACT
jgi:restriction system protein